MTRICFPADGNRCFPADGNSRHADGLFRVMTKEKARADYNRAHAHCVRARTDLDTARDDFDKALDKARADFDKALDKARDDFDKALDKARADLDKARD